MRSTFRQAILLTALVAVPARAPAGWLVDWTNIATKPTGERADPQPSTMAIASDRVRLAQAQSITLVDYNKNTFAVLNPTTHVFWSGSVDDYARHVAGSRADALRQRMSDAGPKDTVPRSEVVLPKIDPAKVPPISINSAGITEKIAGYDTVKYLVQVDGELFQEIWVASALDMSADLNIDHYLVYQQKMNAGMSGKAAGQYNALYTSDQFRKLIEKGSILKMITHHYAGSFERTATAVRQADVAASEFSVPDDYRKVTLTSVLPAPPPDEQRPASAGAAAVRPGGR